jgi:hypothetical protein
MKHFLKEAIELLNYKTPKAIIKFIQAETIIGNPPYNTKKK